MARDQDSVQAERAGRSHIAPLVLVKLTTYTNRIDKTVDKVFYFSNLTCKYDYGITGIDQVFLPVIVGGSDFFSGFAHLPAPDDLTSFAQEFNLHLDNTVPFNGNRMAELLQGYNLEGASIEIAQMLLTHAEMDSYADLKCIDLTGYDGDEHLVLFHGRVNRVAPITAELVTIQCTTELPSMAGKWSYATDDTQVDPLDLGKRLPKIYGNAKRVPLVNKNVGWLSTFVDAVDSSETGTKKITDGTGLPSGSFDIRVDGEEMECSGAADTTLDIVAREQNGTAAAAHTAGAFFSELVGSATYAIADHAVDSLDNLYVVNPINGMLLRLDSGATPWTPNLSGGTIAFFAAQLSTLMDYFQTQAVGVGGVTQQPDFSASGSAAASVMVPITAIEMDDPALNPDGVTGPGGSYAMVNDSLTLPRAFVQFHVADAYDRGINMWCPTGGAPSSDAGVVRFRVVLACDTKPHDFQHAYIRLSYDFFGINGSTYKYVQTSDSTERGVTIVGPWHEPSGKTVGQIERSSSPSISTDENFLSVFITIPDAATTTEGGIDIWTDSSYVEIEIESEVTLSRDDDVITSSGASVGYGLRFFADVRGIVAPGTSSTYSQIEDFENGSWSAANCTAELSTDRYATGSKSLKISADLDSMASLEIDCDSLTGWTGTDCALALVDEGHTQGSNCIEADANDGVNDGLVEFYDAGLGLDLEKDGRFESTGYESVVFDFKIKKAGTGGYIWFYLGTSDGGDYDYIKISVSEFTHNTWCTIVLHPADMTDGAGSLDWVDVNYFAVRFNEPTRSADCKVYIDNIRTVPRNHIAQKNSMGGRDYYAPYDNIAREIWKDYTEELPDLLEDRGDLIISEDITTGTTLPDNYSWHRFIYDGYFEQWRDGEVSGANDVGDATDPTNVNTLRFICRTPGGIQDLDPTIVWYIDNLRKEVIPRVDYKAGEGYLMTSPADIMRHWIEEVGGESIDFDTYNDYYTAVASAWGFDARSLGFSWEEVLQRMAFEGRCNIVPVETALGRVWKMLSADYDYGFGAATGTITQTDGMTDIGRGVDDLASHFTFRYAFDASLPGGGNEEGFRLALVANPSTSDVLIAVGDIADAAERFGAIESGPIAFRCIQAESTAEQVAGYMVQERIANDRRVYQLPAVAWFDALPYDVGDIVSITASWSSAATLCRIASMSKAFTSNVWTLTTVEVLETGTRT